MKVPIALLLIASSAGAQSWLDRGMAEYSSRKYPQAVASLQQAVSDDPGSDVAHYYLANAYLSLGKKDRAIVEYKRAYELSHSPEMSANCKTVLDTYHVPVPKLQIESWQSRSARANLSPYTVASREDITAKAQQSGGRRMDSHRDGVAVFEAAPENRGELQREWDRWIENFRLSFNTVLFRDLGPLRKALSGRSEMVFSVDSRQRLRARVVRSDAPSFFNEQLLQTTRTLDGNRVLSFPRESTIPGYNFTMSWDYGTPRPYESTMAELRNAYAQLRSQQQTAQQAVAGSLGNRNTAATASSTSTNAALKSSNTSTALQGTQGALQGTDLTGIPLPKFDAKVSGTLLPKVELRAQPQLLTPPKKAKGK